MPGCVRDVYLIISTPEGPEGPGDPGDPRCTGIEVPQQVGGRGLCKVAVQWGESRMKDCSMFPSPVRFSARPYILYTYILHTVFVTILRTVD